MLSLLAVGALVVLGTGAIHAQSVDIPAWVKNTALLWAQGDIGDDVFVGALQFLINEGIITVPGASVSVTENEPVGAERPEVEPVECVLEQEHAQPRTIMDAAGEYAISGGFDESSFNSGDLIRVSYETDAPQDVGIKVGIFNPTGDLICSGTITANDFGIARTTFNLPPYYNIDERLELIAFFQGEPDRKFTSTTTMTGLKTSLEVDRTTVSDIPHTAVIKLSSAISEDVRLRVFDSDSEILHDEIVTTNDFGTANVEYTIPPYYLENEQISIRASFADDPDVAERSVESTVPFTKAGLTITSDKDAHYANEDITITVRTDPPVSADITIVASGDRYCLDANDGTDLFSRSGARTIHPDADGIATITGNICDSSGWDGVEIYTLDKRFELAERLSVPLTKAGLTITSDKSAYATGDRITITVRTDPPVSADITIVASGDRYCLDANDGTDLFSRSGARTIHPDADGIATITGNICDSSGWDGVEIYTLDKRFELAGRLTIQAR